MGASRSLPPDNTFDWREAARVDHPPSAFDKNLEDRDGNQTGLESICADRPSRQSKRPRESYSEMSENRGTRPPGRQTYFPWAFRHLQSVRFEAFGEGLGNFHKKGRRCSPFSNPDWAALTASISSWATT